MSIILKEKRGRSVVKEMEELIRLIRSSVQAKRAKPLQSMMILFNVAVSNLDNMASDDRDDSA